MAQGSEIVQIRWHLVNTISGQPFDCKSDTCHLDKGAYWKHDILSKMQTDKHERETGLINIHQTKSTALTHLFKSPLLKNHLNKYMKESLRHTQILQMKHIGASNLLMPIHIPFTSVFPFQSARVPSCLARMTKTRANRIRARAVREHIIG